MESAKLDSKAATKVYEDYQTHFSAPCESSVTVILSILRRRYPDWTVTITPASTGLIPFAKAGLSKAEFVFSEDFFNLSKAYQPPKGRMPSEPGQIKDKIVFGRYNYTWNKHDYIVYQAEYDEGGWGRRAKTLFILAKREEGPSTGPSPDHVDELITAAAAWSEELHEEILVFDQEEWLKDKELYQAVSSSNWDDVILSKEMKDDLINDVEGFFSAEEDYKEFAVPWKRGVIFHGVGSFPSHKALESILIAISIDTWQWQNDQHQSNHARPRFTKRSNSNPLCQVISRLSQQLLRHPPNLRQSTTNDALPARFRGS